MNNENEKYLDSFVCLEFLPLLENIEDRVAFFTGVCSSNNLPKEEMIEIAKQLNLLVEFSGNNISPEKNINLHFQNGSDCRKVIQNLGITSTNCSKICTNCPHNPRYSKKNIHEQEVILAGMYKFGYEVIPKSVLSSITYTVYFLGDNPSHLKALQIPVRGELYKALSFPDGYSSEKVMFDTIKSNLFKQLARKKGFTVQEQNKLSEEIKKYVTTILNLDVSEEDLKEAYGNLSEHPNNKKTASNKNTQPSIDEIASSASISTEYPDTEIVQPEECEELNVEGEAIASPIEESSPASEEADTETPDNDNECPYSDNYVDIDDTNTSEQDMESEEAYVIEEADNADTNEPPLSSEPKDIDVSSSSGDGSNEESTEKFHDSVCNYKSGIRIDRKTYTGTFNSAMNFECIRHALDLAYLSDNLAIDLVTCETIEGIMLYSKAFDNSNVYNGKPLFIRKEFYTERLFKELFESHSYRLISITIEPLCEIARNYNVKHFIDCFSIRASYKALNEDNEEFYPIRKIFEDCNFTIPDDKAFYTRYAIKNYSILRNELIYRLDTKHIRKRAHIWTSYEIILSTANISVNRIGLNISNLQRHSFSSATFGYKDMVVENNRSTILKCVFSTDVNKNSLPSRFIPNLLNQVFTSAPFKDIGTELLDYGNDHLTVLIKSKNQDTIVVAFEILHTILVRLCLRSGMKAPRITDYQN